MKKILVVLVLAVLVLPVHAQNFSPTSIDSLLVWFRADSGITQSGGVVTRWDDGGGWVNDSVVQSSNAARPLYMTDAGPLMNNKPVVSFDGVDDNLLGGTVLGINDSSLSVFIVASNDGQASGTPGLIHIGSNTSYYIYRSATGQLVLYNGGGVTSAAGVLPLTGFPYQLFSIVKTLSTNVKAQINGTQVINATSATGAFTNGQFRLGRINTAVGFWKGKIAEVIIYRRALDANQKTSVENYLYDKYAPPVNLGPDVMQTNSLCPVILNASKRFTNYLWSDNSTGDTLKVIHSGTYWVRATDIFGRVSVDTIAVTLPEVRLAQSDTIICLGNSIVLNTTLGGGSFNYLWSDNSTANTLLAQNPGEYYVVVSDIANPSCKVASDTITVTVDSFNTTVSLGPDLSLCANNSISLVNPPSASWPGLLFNWQPGNINTPLYTIINSGQYNVMVTNANGCVGRDTIDITVIGSAPIVAFTVDTVCLGEAYQPVNTSVSTDATPIVSYQWDFGDSNHSTVASPQHIYLTPGLYNVSLLVATSGGCTNSLTKQQLVRGLPVASFNASAQGCINNSVQFVNNSMAANGSSIVQTQWYLGDGGSSVQQQLQYAYAAAGTYQPQLIVIDDFGCVDTVNGQINIVANAPASDEASLILPVNNSQQSSTSVNFVWGGSSQYYTLLLANNPNFANATIVSTTDTSYTTILQGNATYYWKVRTYNICNDSIESIVKTFNIFSPLDLPNGLVWFKADSGLVHSGGTVSRWNDVMGVVNDSVEQLTAVARPGYLPSASPLLNNMPAVYFDGVDDNLLGGNVAGINDSSISIFIVAANDSQGGTPGLIHIGGNTSYYLYRNATGQLVIYNGGNILSAAGIMPLSGHPYRVISEVKTLNVGTSAYINSSQVINSTSVANAGSFTNGQFRLGRINIAGGFWKGAIAEVIIYRRALNTTEVANVENYLYNKYAPPVNLGPDIKQNYSICPVTLNASNRFTSYLWNDGSTADTLIVKAGGTYWVRVVDVFGRTSTDTVDIVLPFQGMSINDTLLCKGNSVNVQPLLNGSPYTFLWNNGQTTQSISISEPGKYAVNIIDTNLCALVTDTLYIAVDSFTEISLLPTDTITCTGNLLAINDNGYSIVDIEWSTSGQNSSIIISSAGTYSVTATNVNQCIVSDTIAVTIKGTAPIVDFTFNNACLGSPTMLNDLSTANLPDQINSWTWNYGDTNIGNGQNVNHVYDLPGVYSVSLTAITDSGCSASIAKDVSVFGLPNAVITQLAPICAQNASRLSGVSVAPVGAVISGWEWQVGGSVVSLDTFLRYPFPQQGIVPVTLAVTTNQGCKDTITRDIEIYAPFVADFEVANVCVGDSSYFFDVTPSFSIINRTWNFGDATSVSGTKDPVKKYNNAGTYNVTLTVTNAIGCRDTSVKTVIAASKPLAKFGNLSGCEDAFYAPLDSSTSAQEPINSWQWTIGGFNYNAQAPQRYFANPGSYPVKLVVRTPTGCADSVTKTAIIHPRPAANFSYVPLYGDAPLNVTFTNQSTNDSTYLWEFGDGDVSTLKNPVHTYTENGNYNVKLTATSPYGCTASRTKPYTVIQTDLDFAVNEADVQVTPLPDGSSLAEVSLIGSNIGTRIIDQITFYITLGGVGVIAEDWTGTLYTGEILANTFSAKFVVPAGKGDSYICVTATSVNNGQEELRIDNNSQCFGITEGIKVMGPLPNPALHQSSLGLILPKHGKVTIDIANMMGQYVVKGIELDLPEGRSDYELPIGQMVAGEYFIRILYNDEKVVRKFIISR